MTNPLLQVTDLVKHYDKVNAVNGVDFTLEQGICFGLLGPNGAGKTTTIEMLEGITPITSGEIFYKGSPIGSQFQHEAGIMFQSTALQDYITVKETLQMFADLYQKNADLNILIQRCNLTDYLDQDNRELSGGQRQRLLLAIALVNDPDIIFLDEPTTGLDPQARRNFWQLIEDIKAEGKTIILTTHYMEEAYILCDEIAIMDKGKIIAKNTPKSLLESHFNDVILQIPKSELGNGSKFPFSTVETGDVVEIATSDVNNVVKELIANNISLAQLQIRQRTLDDLFLELTGNELRT